ncbi:MAG: helix-turn-helix domain-containing protein [Oscillospiraceae bacterium]|nr:helix-turn-helix domain-containing protein [Oscillospiraceae bacterium]
MEVNDVYRLLAQYNDDELFYKELFLSRKDPVKYARLMKTLSVEKTNQRKLIVPEFNTDGYRPTRFSDDFLDTKIHKNVYLQKHNRYTPPYEHDHEFFEIVYVLSGQCENHIFGGIDTLKQGDLCLMSPSVKHSIWTEDGMIINILIRHSTIQNVFSNLFRSNNIISDFFTNSIYLRDFATCLIFRTDGDKYIREQLLAMFGEQLDSDEYSENIISSMLIVFFNKLVRGYKNTAAYPQTVRKQNESVSRIMSMIIDNFADITLPDIADRLGYSVVYCSKYIKKTMGCTFSELLKKVRLQKAEDLLRNTSMSVSEISVICGYENPENFNRTFRQCYGMAPSVFRENIK